MKKLLAIVPLILLIAACSDENSFKFNEIDRNSTEIEQADIQPESQSEETTTPVEKDSTADVVEDDDSEVNVEEETDVVEENKDQATEETTEEATEESKHNVEANAVKDEATTKEAVVENKGLVEYMPKKAMKKFFLLEGIEIVREVKEVKGNLLLESITFGDVETIQISKWTPTKLSMLFNNSEGVKDVTISNFESTTAPEVYIDLEKDLKGPQAWKVIDKSLTLKLPSGSYKDVLVIEQTITSETSDQVTISRFFYGKGLGLIKEETVTKFADSETSYSMEMNKVE